LINLRALIPGTVIRLSNGALATVTDNPGDGVWLTVRYSQVPNAPQRAGEEEPVFAETIVSIESGEATDPTFPVTDS